MTANARSLATPSAIPPIGVTGIARSMLQEFPTEKPENAGNIVHGNAPFAILPNAYFSVDRAWSHYTSRRNFRDFVNEHCSHLVVTAANLIRVGNFRPQTIERYRLFKERLEGYDRPIVIFGLGAQANEDHLERELPDEAIDLIRYLSTRCLAISVRGEFTASLFRKYANDANVHITGCPSFFSRPEAFTQLREYLKNPSSGMPAYAGTHYSNLNEQLMLTEAIRSDAFWVEPANADLHSFFLDSLTSPEVAEIPSFLRPLIAGWSPEFTRQRLQDYFVRRYRLFRDLSPWRSFNQELVSLTYGTRFHVNMASLLSGRPALWIRHDARTRELVDHLQLPSLDLATASGMGLKDLSQVVDYEPMFDSLADTFKRFNDFLDAAKLPRVSLSF